MPALPYPPSMPYPSRPAILRGASFGMQEPKTQNPHLRSEIESFLSDLLMIEDESRLGATLSAANEAMRQADAKSGWPLGGGACGDILRRGAFSTELAGPVSDWGAAMRMTVANLLETPVPTVLMWGQKGALFYNNSYAPLLGSRHPAAMGRSALSVLPEVADWNAEILRRVFAGETPAYQNQRLRLRDGEHETEYVFDLFYAPVRDFSGEIRGALCKVMDNTARIKAETALARREAELSSVTNAMPALVALVDADLTYRFANDYYRQLLGHDPAEMIGRTIGEMIGPALMGDREAGLRRALQGNDVQEYFHLRDIDGNLHYFDVRYLPQRDATTGQITGIMIIAFDETDRVARQEDLTYSNHRFRRAIDAVHGVLWTNSADGRMVGEQPGWASLTGQSEGEYQGYGWANALHPDDVEPSIAAWQRAVATRGVFEYEHRVRRHDDVWRTFAVRAVPVIGSDGQIREWVGVHTDITHQRAAEAALRDQAETLAAEVRQRERAEADLRSLNEALEARVISEISERRDAEKKLAHAQKMESLGKLTGGVAHDFNNLLQVVSGNLQLLARDVGGIPRAETRVASAMAGLQRGAKLAAQLLAFGRRQALEPKVVNVGRFISGMDELLRRALGEGVEVETILGGGLWNTFIDQAQVENALLNLAINARDAMEGSGRLTIEVANAHLDDDYARQHDEVTPGQYVMIAVSDTGCGIPPEIAEKVFEPFFTTKGEGKGSGLGLSMVYGFVKQSGGHVKLYSEQEHGTTIKLYLPRSLEAEDIAVPRDEGQIVGGNETVLVVEDDDEVRAIVVDMLKDLGYRVLKSPDASAALNVVESGVPIDLIFTDVVMPGPLKSPDLARKAKERIPGVAVLFTSGYTENSIVHGGRLDAGVELLSKPYTREALARKLRHVLANREQQAGAGRSGKTESYSAARSSLTVLLVEDDPLIRMDTAEILREEGMTVEEAGSAEAALRLLSSQPFDVLVSDYHLPGLSGAALARQAVELQKAIRVVFATGDAAAVAPGAAESVLAKPYTVEALVTAVKGEG
ncbi:hybrid sensor histidine kinase/response regulator [Haematobacter massiliensis]|nr:hybrid sensor histidine kinase/response regulator [Haematobacter massiliensis]